MAIVKSQQNGGESRVWWIALLLVALIPLLPEYCAPVLVIASLFAAARDAHLRGKTLRIGTLGKLMLLYIVYMAVGILYSEHKGNSLSTFLMWVVMLCGYLTVTTVVVNSRRLQSALLLVTVTAGVAGAIACLQYVLRDVLGLSLSNQVWLPLDEWFYAHFPMNVDLHMADHRASSTFNNPNILSEYLAMVLPLMCYYSFDGPRTPARLMGRVCLLMGILGIAVSLSRGGYLALLSMVLLLILTNLRRITPLLLSLVAAVSLIPEAIIARFLTIGSNTDLAISGRFAAWDVAVQVIIQSPLTGLGPGVMNFWQHLTERGVDAPHAHNILLQVLVEGGFIALFLLTLVATKLLQNSMELLNRSPKTHFLGAILVIFAVSFVVYGMVDYPFLCPKLVGAFLMVLGFAEASFSIYLRLDPVPLWEVLTVKRLRNFLWRQLKKRRTV